jgi:hypothetical protein
VNASDSGMHDGHNVAIYFVLVCVGYLMALLAASLVQRQMLGQ